MFDDLLTTSEGAIAGAVGDAVKNALLAPGGGLMAQEMQRNFGAGAGSKFDLGPFCIGLGFFALGGAMIVFSFGEDAVTLLAQQLTKAPVVAV